MFGVFARFERVDDGAGVVALEPAISRHGTAAGAVGAGVHHDHAVAGSQQEFRLAQDSDAVVGDTVEEEDPIPIGNFRADFPAQEKRSIGSPNLEIFAGCPNDEEGGLGLANQVGGELAANGMEKRRAGKPSAYSR